MVDAEFGREVGVGMDPARQLGTVLSSSGRALRALPEDVGVEIGQRLRKPEDRLKIEPFAGVKSAFDREEFGARPAAEIMEQAPPSLRIPYKVAGSVVETAPQFAAVAGAQAAGVPAPIAAGAVFGSTEEGFDKWNAALGAAIPVVGKYSGSIASGLSQKLGISNDLALRIVNATGNQVGANALLTGAQAKDILALPEEEQARAWENVITANVGNALIGLAELPGAQTSKAKAVEALVAQLESAPAGRTQSEAVIPRMRMSVPRATAEPFLQPGVPELADAAMREQLSPIVRSDEPAIRALRANVEGITPAQVKAPARKKDVAGGKVSFAAPAEARGIPNARQSVIEQIPDAVQRAQVQAKTPPPSVETGAPPAEPIVTPPKPPTGPNAEAMDSARKIAAMTPDEFLGQAKNFNATKANNIELGLRSTPEQLAELKQLRDSAIAEMEAAKAAGDVETFTKLSSKPQYFSEAIELGEMMQSGEMRYDGKVAGRLQFHDNKTQSSFVVPEMSKASDITAKMNEIRKGFEAQESETSKPSDIANQIADKLNNLKSGVDPQRGDLGTFNVIPKVWDAAIEIAQKIIRAGGTAADAVQAALKHIRENNGGKTFLEREAVRELNAALESPAASPKSSIELPAQSAGAKTGGEAGVPDASKIPGGTATGDEVKMRTLSARGTTSEKIPEPTQERIDNAPESYYRTQSLKGVEQLAREKSDAELAATTRDSDSYTADRLELTNRLFARDKVDEAYNVFQELSADLTRMGQVINQAKLFQALLPENVVRVVNEGLKKGGYDTLTEKQAGELADLAKQRIERTTEMDRAAREWLEKPTDELAKRAESLLEQANEAALAEQRYIHKFDRRSTPELIKTILQGNLLTPVSQVANLVGNVNFMPFRFLTRELGSSFDAIDAHIRNRPRKIAPGNIRGSLAGAKEGAKQIPSILRHGQQGAIKGEIRSGLHPMKAWARQFAKNPDGPTKGGKIPFSDRVNLAIEGTFGVPAEGMLRLLGAGDAPFRGAARGRLIAEQANIQKIPKGQQGMAQKFPELFFDAETMRRIDNEAAEAIFQGESSTIRKLTSWLKEKGDFADMLATTVIPYKLTPWNIIKETLSYNPVVAAAQTARYAAKGETRKAEMSAGKFLVGSTLSAAAWWLYQNGLIAPSMDSRDEQQKARILAGQVLPPNHINISGLKRAMEGGNPEFQPGDQTVDTFRAGGLAGSVMYMMANIGRDMEKNPSQSEALMSVIKNSTIEQARFGMNQSFLKGVAGTLEAIQTGNTDSYVQSLANSVMSVPLPNTLSVISRARREYKPEIKADTTLKQLENALRNRLGFTGLDEQLPLKRGLWGEPLPETPKDRSALLYHFFDVSKGQQVTDDPVPLELYRLWRKTSDTRVIPTPPQKVFTFQSDQYNLTPEQQSRLAELVGQDRRRIVDKMVINENFQRLSDEWKIKMLQKAYDLGDDRARMLFYRENRQQLAPKQAKTGFKQ